MASADAALAYHSTKLTGMPADSGITVLPHMWRKLSDLCPKALHCPTNELKAFHLSTMIAFNCLGL